MKLPFGLQLSDQRMAGPHDVAKGLQCNCVCPGCDAPLVARQGDRNEWHFAHAAGGDCHGGVESAIHRMAKQLIVDRRQIFLPQHAVSRHVAGLGWSEELSVTIQGSELCDLTECREEVQYEGRRPDILAVLPCGMPIAIEVALSHFCDSGKEQWMQERDLTVLEIDVSSVKYSPISKMVDELSNILFENSRFSVWLNHSKRSEALAVLDHRERELRDRYVQKERIEAERMQKAAFEEHEYSKRQFDAAHLKRNGLRPAYGGTEDDKDYFDCTKEIESRLINVAPRGVIRIARSASRVAMRLDGHSRTISPDQLQAMQKIGRVFNGRYLSRYSCWLFGAGTPRPLIADLFRKIISYSSDQLARQ